MQSRATIPELAMFSRPEWQMSPGERVALEGVLTQRKPGLSIEIGTAEGGSLERIAAHSDEVHALDLTDDLLSGVPANATFHKGDSKQTLPPLLAGFAAEGRNVDFVLVDGDHTVEGARADLANLLDSPAIGQTLILLHDSFNAEVRAGIAAADPAAREKVLGFDLDFVPGRAAKLGPFTDQLVGGFAFVVVDAAAAAAGAQGVELGFWSLTPKPELFYDSHETFRRSSQLFGVEGDRGAPEAERIPLDAANLGRVQVHRQLDAIQASWSWRLTAPGRALMARLRSMRSRG